MIRLFDEIPRLGDDRIVLRKLEASDADDLRDMATRPPCKRPASATVWRSAAGDRGSPPGSWR